MRCSECGTPVKPVVAVDIDGTLGDYHGHFITFAEQYLGARLPRRYQGGVEFSDYLQIEKSLYRQVKLAYRQGGMKRSMPVYDDAVQFMQQLAAHGVEVWIATTRPWMRLDNIDPDTREWLARNEIPWDYMIYGEDKYEQLLERVDRERVLAVIDDELENILKAQSLGLNTLQAWRKHNEASRSGVGFDYWWEGQLVIRESLEAFQKLRSDHRSDHGSIQRPREGDRSIAF